MAWLVRLATVGYLDTDELKMAFRARRVSGSFEKRAPGRRRKFPFRKRSMPFSRHLEIFLTVNEFFSTKLKKKENL